MENLKECQWEGYRQLQFEVGGRPGLVVCPKQPLPGNPWVWRTEFFGAFDMADRALLKEGWHIAYHQVSNMYGNTLSVLWLHRFYQEVTRELSLCPRAALFGFSRGGLYARAYAEAYPQETLCLYLDAPVVDICSWPGGIGTGEGDACCFEECLAAFDLTREQAVARRGDCLNRLHVLAQADIPVILVAGDADTVVPYEENGRRLAEGYQALGGRLQVIIKPGVGHHPHSLEDPTPIVDFIQGVWRQYQG